MINAFYFVGKYGDVGHDEKAAGIERGRAYPVFTTYDRSNPKQKHTCAWFVHEDDAVRFAEHKNYETSVKKVQESPDKVGYSIVCQRCFIQPASMYGKHSVELCDTCYTKEILSHD